MKTKNEEDVEQQDKVIRIFVNTTKDYQIWDIDESFTNDIKQLIEDRRDGIISQEEEYSQIYEILKQHGKCIVQNIDFGIKVEPDEEENKQHICICKEHDDIITRIIDNAKLVDNVTDPIKKQKLKKRINKLSALVSLVIISITICYIYIGK